MTDSSAREGNIEYESRAFSSVSVKVHFFSSTDGGMSEEHRNQLKELSVAKVVTI